jgi:hypothetical protein
MTEKSFDLGDVERLAATLEVASLDEKDRGTLQALFALAGQAAAGGSDEVSGFTIVYQRPTSPAAGGWDLFGTFKGGMDWSGPGDEGPEE